MERVQVVVTGANIDYATCHRWRGEANEASCVIDPLLRPSCSIGRLEVVITGADIDHTTRHRWRGVGNGVSCVVGPFLRQTTNGCWIEKLLIRIGVGMLGIKAKHDAVGRYKPGIAIGSSPGRCCRLRPS